MSEWQPIETAPKDKTEVLLGWSQDHYYKGTRIGYCYEDSWASCETSCFFPIDPTHWQPLPAPPENTNAAKKIS